MHTRREAIVSAARALASTAFCLGGPNLLAAPQQPPGPGRRAGHAMAYHAGAGAVCLLGGDPEGKDVTREQPWFWNGRQWTMRVTREAPGVASLVAAASDPERRSILAFGGFTVLGPRRYGPPAGDLWELDSDLTWRRRSVQGLHPEPRHHHALAFDTARGRLD